MALPSFLKRKESAAKATAPPTAAAEAQQARTRARQRLIGAAVLLAIGVVTFPLLFETQPRPIPVDVPIVGSTRDSSPSAPASSKPGKVAGVPPLVEPRAPEPAAAPLAASSAAPVREPPASIPLPAARPAAVPASQSPAPAVPGAASAAEGKGGRFVVQVGAFADPAAVREVRQKVERLGLKTYTQQVDTDGGKRTRVRVGPFETRDEAAKALATLKGAKLPGVVLTL